ncbi:DUF6909 family protein [Tunicatimonas pelagia]|uniref:DUF6909 family protein n=1 Tax=Tunicatimonas pelagia TaxID=931531 RepID=UPI002666A2B3|nr:hypothetical protein [Tunicatimonas pelagia]WKN42866.1 hypothetical protein P0M28_27905 [Tunicatimonas pelagia]
MTRSRAQESRAAIEKMYITMRHLFIRGSYKPLGVSGESLIQALHVLQPEIYGLINDPERVEINGLLYVLDRLPRGIEECRYIKLISREGYENSSFEAIIPSKRRRNCYRVDDLQMYVEMTRGRSDIYDILTHLTFLYNEAEKIRQNALDHKGRETPDWFKLRELVEKEEREEECDLEAAYSYLSNILSRTYEETREAYQRFSNDPTRNSLFRIVYYLGKLSIEEAKGEGDREVKFSNTLRERIGHHVYGELWANNIKSILTEKNLISRPIHVISANLHSIVNTIYGYHALGKSDYAAIEQLATEISQNKKPQLAKKIRDFALKNGLTEVVDQSGTNISVQIIDTAQLPNEHIAPGIPRLDTDVEQLPVLLVMDYAFGEQAYECMDELLKPYDEKQGSYPLRIESISIMGKAGILEGSKGDIMIPTAHVFEGTADNYPLENEVDVQALSGHGLKVFEGPMITVLGTSLQNKEVLRYFFRSSWQAIGLEMEGAHYQKAIQAAAKIRNSINPEVKLRYAYYASDNPLETGSTLASGSLGLEGVKPTYLISYHFLQQIFTEKAVKTLEEVNS